MRHIYHQNCTDCIGNFPEFFEIDGAAVCAGTSNDHFGLDFFCGFHHGIVIQEAVVINAIGDNVEIFTGNVNRAAVAQVTAVIQVHAHNRISRIQNGKENSQVCLCTGMWLYIGIIAAKQFLGTLNGDGFYDINLFTSAVIALARISFCILVGQDTAHCVHDRLADNVFAGNQFNGTSLSGKLCLHGCADFCVIVCNLLHDFIYHFFTPFSTYFSSKQETHTNANGSSCANSVASCCPNDGKFCLKILYYIFSLLSSRVFCLQKFPNGSQ